MFNRSRPNGLFTALIVTAAVVMAGCSTTKLDEPPVESRNPLQGGTAGGAAGARPAAGTGATSQSAVATVDLASAQAALAAAAAKAGRVVYFDYDSFLVKDEFRPLLDAHAKVMQANKARKVSIEGHTDERGGREYNLALGQRRAEAVLRQMVILGVADAQMEAVSFGEERPAAQGQDEAAFAKNRRAELKDR